MKVDEYANRPKAKYIGCTHDGWQHTELHYEYRGHYYIITKHNNGYMDEPMHKRHQMEQRKIDEMIEHENDPIPECKYEGSAQEGFDLFWDYVEGENDEW